jgi:hypothetical protein
VIAQWRITEITATDLPRLADGYQAVGYRRKRLGYKIIDFTSQVPEY